jgi:hypothetical protein
MLKDGSDDYMGKLMEKSEEEVVAEMDESMLRRDRLETFEDHCPYKSHTTITTIRFWWVDVKR